MRALFGCSVVLSLLVGCSSVHRDGCCPSPCGPRWQAAVPRGCEGLPNAPHLPTPPRGPCAPTPPCAPCAPTPPAASCCHHDVCDPCEPCHSHCHHVICCHCHHHCPPKPCKAPEPERRPAVLLQVVDEVDPVQLGTTTTYRITVTNQGSAPDTNIRVEAALEAQAELASAQGATAARAEGAAIRFEPLAELAPGASAVWTVSVKAVGEGDVRFQASVTCDELTRPVVETEATRFYR